MTAGFLGFYEEAGICEKGAFYNGSTYSETTGIYFVG